MRTDEHSWLPRLNQRHGFGDWMQRPAAKSLIDVIIGVAERHGERVALWVKEEEATYRELLERAECIAAQLLDAGVRQGDCIGILTGRSLTAYVGILAALRAGGVYVPMNLRFPRERNLAMLRRAKVSAIVADAAGLASIPVADLAALGSFE